LRAIYVKYGKLYAPLANHFLGYVHYLMVRSYKRTCYKRKTFFRRSFFEHPLSAIYILCYFPRKSIPDYKSNNWQKRL